MIVETLKEMAKSDKRVSIYTDINEPSKFCYGYILCVNYEEVAIYMISPDGFFDGILMKKIYDIIRIEIDGQYHEKMKKLCSLSKMQPFNYSIDPTNIQYSLLEIALQSKQIVSLELVDSGYDDVVGFVESIDNGLCKIKIVDEYGFEDGYCFVMANKITQISYASQDEIRILKLWEINNS
ncbi:MULTISPECIES: hypothetical protein [unclassified Ruminococcus]|uniref:hypothetical protein n=1 Tax=unclassified Ruminococcus TaxID=2608920 RepID=UPI00210D7883|nr:MULTISPECIES: hypothetical protein [unclassified Ruminococcus]MCQ4021805.1 hypothetical protein [Ruminococcus sp. zg-924]MCQ4114250.1 hypothetical protein [Ruminococcus sp. zg-921]